MMIYSKANQIRRQNLAKVMPKDKGLYLEYMAEANNRKRMNGFPVTSIKVWQGLAGPDIIKVVRIMNAKKKRRGEECL